MLKNLICQIALPALLFLFFGLTQAVNAQNNWSQNNKVTKSENGKTLPNVVIILADDMGYSDLQGYGGVANTPNLDALASEGVKFTNCYAGAPNCSPSRVGLLTGRIPARAGMYSYRPPGSPMHLPDNEITIAELLKPAGPGP